MKIAVVYYSLSGNVQYVADAISARFGAQVVRLVPQKAYPDKGFRKFFWGGKSAVMGEKPPLEPYDFDVDCDLVVIGSPVWASTFAPPVRTFIEDNASVLHGKRIAAFMCLSGGGGDKALAKLQKQLGVDNFAATALLVDPKDKPTEVTQATLDAFLSSLQSL